MNDAIPFTREQAIALHDSRFWEYLTLEQRAHFQMAEPTLCMPFDVFHEAVEKTLDRPVYTHEFGTNWEGLQAELYGDRPAPTMQEILDLIPADKRVVL